MIYTPQKNRNYNTDDMKIRRCGIMVLLTMKQPATLVQRSVTLSEKIKRNKIV